MRKLFWGTVAACLLAGGLGVAHFTLKMRRAPAESAPAGEEQEAPRAAFVSLPHSTPSVEQLLESMDIIEPIVVEGPPADPPPAPEFGGAALPSEGVRVAALGSTQPPRPDEEAGRRAKMPYVVDGQGERWFGGQLWDALQRLFGGSEATVPTSLNETAEPPALEEPSEPTAMKTPLPPVVDYHYHQNDVHCPYTGRCPVPPYPVAPPAAPQVR